MLKETSNELTRHIDWLVYVIGQTDKYSRDQRGAIGSAFRLCKQLPDREQKIRAYLKCREVLPGCEEPCKICIEHEILRIITREPNLAVRLTLCDEAKPYVLEGTRFDSQLDGMRSSLRQKIAANTHPAP